MNERMKELIRKCNGYAKDDDGVEALTPVLIGAQIDQFAELIVQECVYLFGVTRTEPSLQKFISDRLGIKK